MKNISVFLILLQLLSCVSTKNVAESRNSEYAAQNNFELFRFWHELDILRFKYNILNVRIGLVPEDRRLVNFESDSQFVHIHDSLMVMIENKMEGFQELKRVYNDTTNPGKQKIYQSFKSDSADLEFLDGMADSPYFELYEDIVHRQRKSIQSSKFYSSPDEFVDYIQNRSIENFDMKLDEGFYRTDSFFVNKLSKRQIDKLNKNQINFLIVYSLSYNIDYSDRAGGRIGSESVHMNLFDMKSASTITSARITRYWGNE